MAVANLPSIDAQRASVATWSSAPDPLKLRGTDPKAVDFVNKLISSQQRIAQIGQQPVTIVNLNPYKLVVIHPLFDGISVQPIKEGEDYSALVIRDVKYQVDQGLDDNHTPVEFWPVQMAGEFDTQYRERGGVFTIKGDLEKHPELAATAEFKEKRAAAQEQMYSYCYKLYTQANNEWNTPARAGARNIHDPHRQAARILLTARKIGIAPEWMETMVATEDVTPRCQTCQGVPNKGALVCNGCGDILDPAGALARGVITETHVSLERLTRAQVKELGVSAFVAETADEVMERRAAGKSKPLSQFEVRQMKEREKELAGGK